VLRTSPCLQRSAGSAFEHHASNRDRVRFGRDFFADPRRFPETCSGAMRPGGGCAFAAGQRLRKSPLGLAPTRSSCGFGTTGAEALPTRRAPWLFAEPEYCARSSNGAGYREGEHPRITPELSGEPREEAEHALIMGSPRYR